MAVSETVGDLAPATTYEYRLVAVNADAATAVGATRSFTTPAAPAPLVPSTPGPATGDQPAPAPAAVAPLVATKVTVVGKPAARGRTTTVTTTLSARGRALLAREHRLAATLTVRRGTAIVRRAAVTLRQPTS